MRYANYIKFLSSCQGSFFTTGAHACTSCALPISIQQCIEQESDLQSKGKTNVEIQYLEECRLCLAQSQELCDPQHYRGWVILFL